MNRVRQLPIIIVMLKNIIIMMNAKYKKNCAGYYYKGVCGNLCGYSVCKNVGVYIM